MLKCFCELGVEESRDSREAVGHGHVRQDQGIAAMHLQIFWRYDDES
jgi:hypothetical protein